MMLPWGKLTGHKSLDLKRVLLPEWSIPILIAWNTMAIIKLLPLYTCPEIADSLGSTSIVLVVIPPHVSRYNAVILPLSLVAIRH